MKKYFKPFQSFIIIIVWMTLLVSCDVLDQEPENQIDSSRDIIVDEASARAALMGLYDALQDYDYYGAHFIISVDMFTNDIVNGAFDDSYKQLNSYTVPVTNVGAEQLWMQMYRAINVANHILASVPALETDDFFFTPAEKDEIIGSAEMIRGLIYLDLLRTFGEHWDRTSPYGVPLRTTPTTTVTFTPRSSVAATYERILEDLQNARSKLPDTRNPAFATKSAATALLARAHLYMKDYTEAAGYATEVINNPQYTLLSNYADIFSFSNSSESIFELNFNVTDPSFYFQEYSERDEALITYELLLDVFVDEVDTRKGLIIPDPDNPALLTTLKYWEITDPAYIIRLAEMYTIRAEALALGSNNPAAGLPDLNEIRERAKLQALQAEDVPDINAFINALLLEKRKEFYAEGHRFFDLARLRKTGEVYGIEDFRSIFPIPYIEIITAQSNGVTLEQNPGFLSAE